MNWIRDGLAPTPSRVILAFGCMVPATSQKDAALISPGIVISQACSLPFDSIEIVRSSTTIDAPMDARRSSV